MALNCIVDDSALLAGLDKDSKEDLKKWVGNGAVNLFVPLYTLEKLNKMRSSPPPLNLSARQTLEWLDAMTTATEGQSVGRVELQEPDHQYGNWKEVERYLLPDTPLSSGSLDGVADEIRGRLTLQDSRRGATSLRDASTSPDAFLTPESSPETAHTSLVTQNGTTSRNLAQVATDPASTSAIPAAVRPLLNFVVWRTYHGDATIAGSGKYVLLTNDRITQRQAQKFGVRAKMLEQVSGIVAKTAIAHPLLPNGKENGKAAMDRPIEPREAADEAPEDEVVFNPARRPGSSRGKTALNGQILAPAISSAKALDPDHFGRNSGARPAVSPKASPLQPHMPAQAPVRSQRGNYVYHNNSMRGSPGPSSRGQPSQNFRGRGRGGSMRGAPHMNGFGPGAFQQQNGMPNGNGVPAQQYQKPIDPDSYARPLSVRGRGQAMRRLWNPNT